MKKLTFFLLAFILITTGVQSQDSLNLIIRDIDASNFKEIKLYLNILDNSGISVENIDSSRIFINEVNTGKKVNPNVTTFYDSQEGIAFCVIIDASRSLSGEPMNNIKSGLINLLTDLRPVDKLAIGYFHSEFIKSVDFTSDKEILRNNIDRLEATGTASHIYNSFIDAIKWLKSVESPKRKVLIFISDGDDNGKKHTLEECIKEAEDSGLTIFTIGSASEKTIRKGFLDNMEKLGKISAEGSYFKIDESSDLKKFIPVVYDRVKDEYVLTYFSYAEINENINGQIEVHSGATINITDFSYVTPGTVIVNPPALPFWETEEFLWGSIGSGFIILIVLTFLVMNIRKKKQYKLEKEREAELRAKDAIENQNKFDGLRTEYDELLDRLENQNKITDEEREKVMSLENLLLKAQDTISSPGSEQPVVDIRRRTMILDSKSPESMNVEMPVRAALVIKNGAFAGTQYFVENNLTIGRQNADIVIHDNTISKTHARILKVNDSYFIEDLGSTNGTFVNGRRVNQQMITSNDIVKLGSTDLIFKK